MRLQDAYWPMMERDQLLVVCDPGNMAPLLRKRYAQFNVTVSPTYLTGIATLANHPARRLLVGVDPASRKLASAVAGLRKAAGEKARIVLCCHPSGEPAARQALDSGANDYVIYPPRGDELDYALGLPANGLGPEHPIAAVDDSAPSWEELNGLAHVLAGIADGRETMLERLCQWIADSMRSADVQLIAGSESVCVGNGEIEPALTETITASGRQLGQILIGPRHKAPFSAGEAEKLRYYGRMIAHLLEAAEQQRQWQSLALLDPVTQLPNRRYLTKALDQLLLRAAQQRLSVTVLLFDLDGFKHFNDTYGHAAGDETLRETGQLFRRLCRQHDIVARYGGDEFVVVFWDAEEPRVAGSKHPRDILAMLHRIKQALKKHPFPHLGSEGTGCITISGGLASFPWDARDGQGLIERADEALLDAKRAGKNRIHLVDTKNPPKDNPSRVPEDSL